MTISTFINVNVQPLHRHSFTKKLMLRGIATPDRLFTAAGHQHRMRHGRDSGHFDRQRFS